MGQVFITGDKHGDYKEVERFCLEKQTSKEDVLIVLGDNGVNYWGPHRDKKLKRRISDLPITFFMVKGNHDQRPSTKLYHPIDNAHPLIQGTCLTEDDYPSLLFANIFGAYAFLTGGQWKTAVVLGGAYSADKWFRLEQQASGRKAYRWFFDEQMTRLEMEEASAAIHAMKPSVILSHTCPFKYIPQDRLQARTDPSANDDTMERWMDGIETSMPYEAWYCGHWHIDRAVEKLRFMYHDVTAF